MVTKVVFPAAGLGTRFLPATKATPKEMLPVVDRPLIQYAVEEALASGMTDIVMVTGRGKRAIEDHFDISAELESSLHQAGKDELYQEVSRIARMAKIAYVRQKQALGLGHAVLCAQPWLGNEFFAVSLADELMVSERPVMQQLQDVHAQTGCSVIALSEVPVDEVHRYGIVQANKEGDLLRLTDMVEKPDPEDAPSNLAMIGRYIFSPRLLDILAQQQPSVGNEIQLTDAIALLAQEEPVYGLIIQGQRFDTGNPLGFLIANVALGLTHPKYGDDFRHALQDLL
ncbi:MAG: UTP--glucose-1-phosphate uridylyltransferase GalU [Mariprofundaceae bacterium]|nr:UTP--glucose-1-phosphate uridylyltransferase GalU [Mariprofundaceae bacterium]